MTWEVRPSGNAFAVGLVDEEGQVVRLHPIPFHDEREAARAATRLNARDAQRNRPPIIDEFVERMRGVEITTSEADELRVAIGFSERLVG